MFHTFFLSCFFFFCIIISICLWFAVIFVYSRRVIQRSLRNTESSKFTGTNTQRLCYRTESSLDSATFVPDIMYVLHSDRETRAHAMYNEPRAPAVHTKNGRDVCICNWYPRHVFVSHTYTRIRPGDNKTF